METKRKLEKPAARGAVRLFDWRPTAIVSETERPFEQWYGEVHSQLADLRRQQRQRELKHGSGTSAEPGKH